MQQGRAAAGVKAIGAFPGVPRDSAKVRQFGLAAPKLCGHLLPTPAPQATVCAGQL